jgi:hypothetical protein
MLRMFANQGNSDTLGGVVTSPPHSRHFTVIWYMNVSYAVRQYTYVTLYHTSTGAKSNNEWVHEAIVLCHPQIAVRQGCLIGRRIR